MKKASTHLSKEDYKFVLFVSGMSVKSLRAVENIRKIGHDYFNDQLELQIIDINEKADLAVKHQIIAVPTLLKVNPLPLRTIIGDLTDTAKVLKILGITE